MTTPITDLIPKDDRSFIITICKHNIRDGTEKLPPGFVHQFCDTIPNPIVIEVPTKRTWNVDLECYHGRYWLQTGWNKFVSDLSLENEAFLCFTYTDTCTFLVKAWEFHSCNEIEYPPKLPLDNEDAPTFNLTIKYYMIQADSMPLPRSHVQDYLSAKMEHEAILIHDDNSTLVTMSTVPTKSSCFLTNGWKRFAVRNGFTDDDEFEVKVYLNDLGQIMLEFHKI